MPGPSCAVFGCGNGTYGIQRWMKEFCTIHGINKGVGRCVCDPPFRLFTFPTERSDKEGRARWTKLVGIVQFVPSTYKSFKCTHCNACIYLPLKYILDYNPHSCMPMCMYYSTQACFTMTWRFLNNFVMHTWITARVSNLSDEQKGAQW